MMHFICCFKLYIIMSKIFVGRVFCKKACDDDGDTWEECKFPKLYWFSCCRCMYHVEQRNIQILK